MIQLNWEMVYPSLQGDILISGASDQGWPPGQWPRKLGAMGKGNSQPFKLIGFDGDSIAQYEQPGEDGLRLDVLND